MSDAQNQLETEEARALIQTFHTSLGQIREQVGQLHSHRVGPVHGRREMQRVELLADRLNDLAIVVSDRSDVDP